MVREGLPRQGFCTNQWRCLKLGRHEAKPSAVIQPYRIPACDGATLAAVAHQ